MMPRFARFLEVDARPRPTPTIVPAAPGRLLRQRERSADQPDADDDELVDARARRRSSR